MSLTAVTCASCGGAVQMQAGTHMPSCIFCGSEQLAPARPDEMVEVPQRWVPFEADEQVAHASFRRFTRSNLFYPGDLRNATLELKAVLVPAWSWSGDVESHYAALVRADTRSEKRPETGVDRCHIDQALVLASSTLSRAELQAIEPFMAERARDFDADQAQYPFEIGHLTRSVARQEAEAVLQRLHREQLQAFTGALELRVASVFSGLEGAPLLLPVYVGAYRRGKKLYRVVINGQSGRLTGQAPLSVYRVLLAVVLVLILLVVLGLAAQRL